MYTLFFVVLGVAAALWGGWLERAGPRKAGFVAALCWCGGLFLGAIGVYTHQLWILWLGSGVIGGIGLGLGYISPVSTLVKWFPDRRGMATGMAIMGFGGGAMIGAPLANLLMNYFKTPTSVGVWETFVTMGVIYFAFMMIGAWITLNTPFGMFMTYCCSMKWLTGLPPLNRSLVTPAVSPPSGTPDQNGVIDNLEVRDKALTETEVVQLRGIGDRLDLVRVTAGEERDRVKTHLLDLVAVVGNHDERVRKGRTTLMSALF